MQQVCMTQAVAESALLFLRANTNGELVVVEAW